MSGLQQNGASTAGTVKARAAPDSGDREEPMTGDVKEDGSLSSQVGQSQYPKGSRKNLGLIIANYSIRSEELTALSARPIEVASHNEPRTPHSNNSVISMDAIIASSGMRDDNLRIDLDGQAITVHQCDSETRNHKRVTTTATTMTTTGNVNSGGSGDAQSSNSQLNPANNGPAGPSGGQWMMNVAAQTTQEMRQRVSIASDQLGISIRHLCASAATMASQADPPLYQNIPGIVPDYRGRSSGPPPSYDDVINPYAPPPTYQSLFGQMREASKNSRGFVDLLRRLVILSSIGCSLLIAFVVLVPFSMIVVGAVYLNDCRVEHIPGFLLVGGLIWASKNIIHCCVQCHELGNESNDELPDYGYYEEQGSTQTQTTDISSVITGDINIMEPREISASRLRAASEQSPQMVRQTNRRATKSSICESLLNCILFGWFVAGCVIVFRNHNPDFEDPASPRYCNRTVYMFTFWLITSGLVGFSLFVSCLCCLVISSAIATRQDDDLS